MAAFRLRTVAGGTRWPGVHLDTVLILRNLAPSPPSEGGEGWGEEGRPDARNAPLPGPLPARASRGEGVSKDSVEMHPMAISHVFRFVNMPIFCNFPWLGLFNLNQNVL